MNSPALNRRHGAGGENVALHPCRAEIRIGDCERIIDVEPGAREAVCEFDLEPLKGTLDAWFVDGSGERQGAYYVYVERL